MQSCSDKAQNLGLLILRIGLGVMFIMHGFPKIKAGPQKWAGLGAAMSYLGVDFAPSFWGFMAAFAEVVGGLSLILGLLLRPGCVLLTFTMLVAVVFHLKSGHGIMRASHAIEVGIVFLSLLFIGPGKYSLDSKIFSKKE